MTLTTLARLLSKSAVIVRDANAVNRNRVPERVTNRLVAKAAGRLLRGIWR